jgi:hypothetical protein
MFFVVWSLRTLFVVPTLFLGSTFGITNNDNTSSKKKIERGGGGGGDEHNPAKS